MDFPSLGDADQYLEIAGRCAEYLSGTGGSCYHAYRPIGIILYYAIPFLFSSDPVTISYVTLLMNLLLLGILMFAGVRIIRDMSGARASEGALGYRIGEIIFLLSILFISIGFIPVRLADHQSLALFMAAVSILVAQRNVRRPVLLVFAGLLAGASVLLKQNYAVAIFFLIGSWLVMSLKHDFKKNLQAMAWFAAGASLGLLQILWIYTHSGEMWLYSWKAMEVFAPANRQPVVELVAFTDPVKAGYLSNLAQPVTELQYFAIKFYNGLTKFYWAVYSGRAPLEMTPKIVSYSISQIAEYQIIYILVAFVAASSLLARERWLAIIVLTAFLSTSLSTAIAHVESRYFFLLRFAFLMYAVIVFNKMMAYRFRTRSLISSRTAS